MNTFINNQRLARLAGVDYDSEQIKPGRIVYSRTHLVTAQFPYLAGFPSCVLITSFSDACVTGQMAERLPQNVRCWFSNNVLVRHPRVRAVPLGIRTSQEGERLLRQAIGHGRQPQKNLVYMNFNRRLRRTPNPRRGIYEMFGSKSWVTTEGGFEHVPIEQFYRQIVSHPYTLSPPGAGPDCHRHWEAIMLGTIPIVLKSPALQILNDLPCLQVDNWGQVTQEYLERNYGRFAERFQNTKALKRMWFEYWEKEIKKV